jgi:hypothetical protein
MSMPRGRHVRLWPPANVARARLIVMRDETPLTITILLKELL